MVLGLKLGLGLGLMAARRARVSGRSVRACVQGWGWASVYEYARE